MRKNIWSPGSSLASRQDHASLLLGMVGEQGCKLLDRGLAIP